MRPRRLPNTGSSSTRIGTAGVVMSDSPVTLCCGVRDAWTLKMKSVGAMTSKFNSTAYAIRTRLPAISELRCCIGARSTCALRRRQIPVRIEAAGRRCLGVRRGGGGIEIDQGNGAHRFGVDQHFASIHELKALRRVMMRERRVGIDDVPRATALMRVLGDDDIDQRTHRRTSCPRPL